MASADPWRAASREKGLQKEKESFSTKERDLNGGDTTNRRFVASL